MKQTITEKDLDKIAGKFIIQIDADKPIRLTDFRMVSEKNTLEFYLYKRVRFVMFGCTDKGEKTMIESDLFGNTLSCTREEFVEKFNNYLGDSKGKRYHRLLYAEELQVVFDFMTKRNY